MTKPGERVVHSLRGCGSHTCRSLVVRWEEAVCAALLARATFSRWKEWRGRAGAVVTKEVSESRSLGFQLNTRKRPTWSSSGLRPSASSDLGQTPDKEQLRQWTGLPAVLTAATENVCLATGKLCLHCCFILVKD